ncbi:MAG TPA: IS66 family transposase [Gemmataceae bacterium]|jgi:transposase
MKDVECQGCRERDALIQQLRQELHALREEVRQLKELVGRNASNSSLPPSANPSNAAKPVVKEPSTRKAGGQPGHQPHLRLRLPSQRIHQTIHHRPRHCSACRQLLPVEAGSGDPEPTWHQVAELPPLAAQVIEHQGHTRICPACGTVNQAAIPADVRAHSIGPRLAAFMAYLRGCHQVSLRGVEEIVETAFELPVSLGRVCNLEAQVSEALAPAHAEALQAVRQAPVKHADETSWKQAGKLCWLWLAATQQVAAFVVHARRSWQGLQALLGQAGVGIICSDRWSVYDRLAVRQRQVCWAHLRRDFQRMAERGTAAGAWLGEVGGAVVHLLFHWWHAYRGGTISRAELVGELEPVRAEFRGHLKDGRARRDAKVATLCANLLAMEPALWTFLYAEGVEPTNNHAERMVRRGVMWRKCAYGSWSEAGCRFVERMLTVVQTLRLQKRPVLHYLMVAVQAHRDSLPTPSLLSNQ